MSAGSGKTTIVWNSGSSDEGIVMVAVDGGAERLFARGTTGTADAAWIVPGSVFEFRLYTSATPTRRLASVTVTAREQAGASPSQASSESAPSTTRPTITATPNPVPAGPEGRGTEVSWNTGDGSLGRVLVSVDGREASLFASGARGTEFADWIGMNHTYDFRLYREQAPNELIASVVVTRPLARAGESTIFRIVAVAVLVLLASALWRFVRRPEEGPLH